MHIKIGTRKSKLALWQAEHVTAKIKEIGHTSELVLIESEGDLVLDTPLPLMGGKGVFTKALDDALLDKTIDIAVHSFKDIPTELHPELNVVAILERENPSDALVCRKNSDFLTNETAIIATSSNRRKAQWLDKYPHHTIVDIRGNVPTRIKKLRESDWDATILASAGLIRLNLENEINNELDWMISAPAQGAVAILANKENTSIQKTIQDLNHQETALCTNIERSFLNTLNGGCSAPVGAKVVVDGNSLYFKGIVLDPSGETKIEIALEDKIENGNILAKRAAQMAIERGAIDLINNVKNDNK